MERHKPARAKPKHGLDASLDRRARGAMAKALRKPRKPRLKWGAVAPKPAADVTKRLALPPKPAPVAEPLSVSAKAEIKPVMASPLGQMDRPFTPGANEAPKPAPPTATSLTAIKLTEPSKSQPRISGEAAAMSAARRRQPPSLRDIAGMLHLNAERPGTIKVETLLQDYFSVEQSSDIPADALAELLTSIELDEKSIAAIRTKLFGPELALKSVPRAAPPPVKAPWFEVGESVLHDEHGYGCVVLGSESLAGNNGKVQIQLNDGSGDGHGANLFINPAELKPRRVWHPKHGPGNILFELDDGYVSMFFDDKDGSSDIMATELSRCVVLNKEFLSNSDGKLVQHPKLGLGVIVGQEEDGKPIVVFDNRDGSTHVHPAELSPTAFAAPLPGQDRAIACVHVQVPNPFTSSSEVASELPKPVETQKRSVPVIVAEDAEKRAEREAALDAMMIKLFY